MNTKTQFIGGTLYWDKIRPCAQAHLKPRFYKLSFHFILFSLLMETFVYGLKADGCQTGAIQQTDHHLTCCQVLFRGTRAKGHCPQRWSSFEDRPEEEAKQEVQIVNVGFAARVIIESRLKQR